MPSLQELADGLSTARQKLKDKPTPENEAVYKAALLAFSHGMKILADEGAEADAVSA